MSKTKTPIMNLETDEDGWIGGSSQSIYARGPQPSTHASPPPSYKQAKKPSPVTPGRDKSRSRDAKAGSLLERMEMVQQTPPPKGHKAGANGDSKPTESLTPPRTANNATSPFNNTPSPGIRRPGAKLPSPLPLTSPARHNGPASPLNTRTPLSASHPIPETPLKLSQRGGPQTPATPHWPLYPNSARSQTQDGDSSRTSGLGLGLTPLKTPVPLEPSSDSGSSPLNEALNLRGRAASNASIGSPLKANRSGTRGEPLGLGASTSSGKISNDQIDAMLDRVRNTRPSLGTGASMWAPKTASTAGNVAPDTALTSNTSHTIGSGFASSNLLGVQTGLDRKRPSHRPNGLQLSLGQEISVMQNLEENMEEDAVSSAAAGETFQIHSPDIPDVLEEMDDWNGKVVPPTPALGCDSPSSDDGKLGASKPPSRSLDAFGWGGKQSAKGSLFSNLPSSSTLEANWSGDDDDERKNDIEVFEDIQNRAKASKKERRNSAYGPLPPPPINFAKSRTPSPTHRMLAKSPQLDKPGSGDLQTSPLLTNSQVASATSDAGNKPLGQRLSPASARSQLPSDDSDGDADVEGERPKGGRDRKSKKNDSKSEQVQRPDSSRADVSELEKKRSLKRDKSERIRGRRASQSKEKDVDRVKMSAAGPSAEASTIAPAKVSLPTSTLHSKNMEDVGAGIEKVDLNGNVSDKQAASTGKVAMAVTDAQTPVANRVQSIPTVKDDLFSSPAEPKVGLPGKTSSPPSALTSTAGDEAKASVAAPPEPPQPKSFDWAADDDELDDELPDLDDWGVTLSPAKPASTPTFSSVEGEADKGSSKANRHGKAEENVWRRGAKVTAHDDHLPRKGPGGRGKKDSQPASKKDEGPLGIRIAGRAKSATPESERPPASTPYGRWKQPAGEEISIKGSSARPRIAGLGSLAKLLEPADDTRGAAGSIHAQTGAKDSMHASAPAQGQGQGKGMGKTKSPVLGGPTAKNGAGGGARKGRGGKK